MHHHLPFGGVMRHDIHSLDSTLSTLHQRLRSLAQMLQTPSSKRDNLAFSLLVTHLFLSRNVTFRNSFYSINDIISARDALDKFLVARLEEL